MPNPEDPMRDRLLAAGVRPTRPRLALAALLLTGEDRHVTAEDVWEQARRAGHKISLATVYNTLNHFVELGLVARAQVSAQRTLFDTNTTPHHHAWDVTTGEVFDLPPGAVRAELIPGSLPEGVDLDAIDVVVRVRS